jgi:hypothetical protein
VCSIGWKEQECASSSAHELLSYLNIPEGGAAVAWFVFLVGSCWYCNHRLWLWKQAMLPREPFLFVDMQSELEDFNKKDL